MKPTFFRRLILLVLLIPLPLLAACSAFSSPDAISQPVSQESIDAPTLLDLAPANNSEPPSETIPDVLTDTSAAAEAVVEEPLLDTAVALAQLSEQEQAFINTYQQVNPAVVFVDVGIGQGSGFVVDPQGYIVTNNHVVEDASAVQVSFADGSKYPAQIVGTDPGSDLAVLKIQPDAPLTAVAFGDSNNLQVGQIVIAIGSPFGLSGTMTTGIISGLDRFFPADSGFNIPNIIQTDAAINPGNSGGPLLDLQGNLIGVNTAIESPVRGSSGIGYAVPANIVKAIVPQLIQNGRAQHPWMGIAGVDLSSSSISPEEIGLPANQQGILISNVVSGGPAAQAGIRAGNPQSGAGGDVIVGVDGTPIKVFDDLLGYVVEQTAVGQTITLDVLRDGQIVSVPLTLQARPGE